MSKCENVIHALFRCHDCHQEWENFLTAQRLASRHAKEHKHLVAGELGVSVIYDGKQP